MNNTITIAYFYNNKRVTASYKRTDPDWKEAIQTLKEQNKTFRLIYT
jgi:hypothetical protein